jgi:hypothetical protein
MPSIARPRLNIYLHTPRISERVRVAAARSGMSVSAYCEEAIRQRLVDEGLLPPDGSTARTAARALDRLRARQGPLGVPVSELIDEGRRR